MLSLLFPLVPHEHRNFFHNYVNHNQTKINHQWKQMKSNTFKESVIRAISAKQQQIWLHVLNDCVIDPFLLEFSFVIVKKKITKLFLRCIKCIHFMNKASWNCGCEHRENLMNKFDRLQWDPVKPYFRYSLIVMKYFFWLIFFS